MNFIMLSKKLKKQPILVEIITLPPVFGTILYLGKFFLNSSFQGGSAPFFRNTLYLVPKGAFFMSSGPSHRTWPICQSRPRLGQNMLSFNSPGLLV